MICVNPRDVLFNDFSDTEAEKWMKEMKAQPMESWNGTTQYCGWQDVPSTFLICEKDQVLPIQYQLQCAEMAGSKIERCEAGHMVMLSKPEKVVEVIRGVVEG
jgi:pimeloyl-ACP methyl ester carboxylesterase